MEFLCRSATSDGPLVAFGGSDGVIRVLSMITWKVSYLYYFGVHCFTIQVASQIPSNRIKGKLSFYDCSLLEGTQEVIRDQFLV